MKQLLCTLLCVTLALNAFPVLKTAPVNNENNQESGYIYTLPKTRITVEITTTTTKETPGKYFAYAERYLGLTNVCTQEKSNSEIASINIKTEAIPDTKNTFMIYEMPVIKGDANVLLTKEGFLKSVNGNTEFIPEQKKEIFRKKMVKRSGDFKTMESSIVTREMQQSSSTARIAELAANEIFNIRENRKNLLTQDVDKAPSDGQSYEIVLSELNRMEKYYTELFTGKKDQVKNTYTFVYEPENNIESILFRFSKAQGVVDKSDLSGNPVYINISKQQVIEKPQINKGKSKKEETNAGLYYRIPGKASVKITDGINILKESELTIAQFGQIFNLPAKNYKSIELCPLTGNLIKVVE
jgi:hypothetical protein